MTRPSRPLRDTLAAFAAIGRPIKGARLYPNGVIELLTDGPAPPPYANDEADWADLAGETGLHRAPGA
jgi:hypothetical protein